MQKKETTICSLKHNNKRLQLLKVIPGDFSMPKFQVRLNRKLVHSSISEYNERKVFATYCQNIVLQLKIY